MERNFVKESPGRGKSSDFISFDFKERNVLFSEFPVGKFNSVRYPFRDSIFRNIFIAFNGKKKSSSVLAIRASHFKIELTGQRSLSICSLLHI